MNTHTPFIPTARNSERYFSPQQAKADKYLGGERAQTAESKRVARVRQAVAIRLIQRAETYREVMTNGTPWQRGCMRILSGLLAVREAHNPDVLFLRNDVAVGLIEGAAVFGSISREQRERLRVLCDNAYRMRLSELRPGLRESVDIDAGQLVVDGQA